MCKKVHNNYQKHFIPKNWSCNKEVITMGVFVMIWYLPLVRYTHSWQISHPHSWIKIIYKSTHDITSIYTNAVQNVVFLQSNSYYFCLFRIYTYIHDPFFPNRLKSGPTIISVWIGRPGGMGSRSVTQSPWFRSHAQFGECMWLGTGSLSDPCLAGWT